MAADLGLKFWGLSHIPWQKVQVTIGGIYAGEYVVEPLQGYIIVPFGADDDGILTATYVSGLDGYTGDSATSVTFNDGSGSATYTIPVTVGIKYTSKMKLLRSVTQDDMKQPQGAGIGRTRRGHSAGIQLTNTVGPIKVGTDYADNIVSFPLRKAGTSDNTVGSEMFTGVLQVPLKGSADYDSAMTIEIERPTPATIVAISVFQEGESR